MTFTLFLGSKFDNKGAKENYENPAKGFNLLLALEFNPAKTHCFSLFSYTLTHGNELLFK